MNDPKLYPCGRTPHANDHVAQHLSIHCNVGSDPTQEFVNDGRGFIVGSEAEFPI